MLGDENDSANCNWTPRFRYLANNNSNKQFTNKVQSNIFPASQACSLCASVRVIWNQVSSSQGCSRPRTVLAYMYLWMFVPNVPWLAEGCFDGGYLCSAELSLVGIYPMTQHAEQQKVFRLFLLSFNAVCKYELQYLFFSCIFHSLAFSKLISSGTKLFLLSRLIQKPKILKFPCIRWIRLLY